jgi:lysophospholipase L1-like esterase
VKDFGKISRPLVAAVIAMTFAVMNIAPSSAAPGPDTQGAKPEASYVALGDSYAYGLGADNPVTESYPAVLAVSAGLTLTTAAVPGATTSEVTSFQVPSNRVALQHADLVTLTAGGNDLDAVKVAAICGTQSATDCQTAIASALGKLPKLYTSLGITLKAIRTAAPHARIVVTGYPELFDPSLGPGARQFNTAAFALNTTIEAAVWKSRAHGGNVRFVSVVEPFLKHGLGSADSWINSSGVAPLHPTTTGYREGYYSALSQSRAVSRLPMVTAVR